MYNQRSAEELNKEYLLQDKDFLADASAFLQARTGNVYVSPDDIFDGYMNHMRWHSTNDVTPFRDLRFAQDADPEMKDKMARLFQTYDQMEATANDDILEAGQAVLDYGGSILASPSTWTSLLTAGAGKIASLGAQKAARVGVRGMLYSGINMAAKRPVASSAVAGAVIEGSAAGATEKARQMGRVETGAQEEESASAIALNTLIGTTAGGVGGAVTGLLKAKQVENANNFIKKAEEAHNKRVEEAAKTADEVIEGSKDKEKIVLDRLRPLNEEMVQSGRKINEEQLSGNELLLRTMDQPTKKAITAAAIELVGDDPKLIQQMIDDPTKRITEVVAERIQIGKGQGGITVDELSEIAQKYNLTQQQLGLIFTADISDAARSLQLVGQIKKAVKERIETLAGDMQKAVDEKTGRGISVSEEQLEELGSLSEGFNKFKNATAGTLQGFERMRRSFLTSQVQTVVRNFAGGGARVLIDMPERLFEQVTKKLMNAAFKKKVVDGKTGKISFEPRYEDDLVVDSLSIAKYLNPIGMNGESRVMADVIAEMFNRSNPDSAQRLFGTFIDGAEVARKGKLGGVLESAGVAVNFANRFADNYYKKAIFAGHLDRLVRNRMGKSLLEVIEEGNFNKIDQKLFTEATDKAFELLYQKTPKNRLAKAYLDLDKMAGSNVLLGAFLPFPRFIMNQLEFMYDHAPILGLVINSSSKQAPERIAKQITGTSMVTAGYMFSAAQGERKNWYDYVNENGETTDMRPFLGPLSMPMYLGDLLQRHYDSTKSHRENVETIVRNTDGRTLAQLIFGSALRVGTGAWFLENGMPELASAVTEGLEGDAKLDDNFLSSQSAQKAYATVVGNYVATLAYNMPTAIARDIYKISDEEARYVNADEYVSFGDIFRARASRSLPQPLKEKVLKKQTQDPITNRRFVITSDRPMKTLDPFSTAVTGLARGSKPTFLEQELAAIGLTSYDLYKPLKFGPAHAMVARELSGNSIVGNKSLTDYIKLFISNSRYQNAPLDQKRFAMISASKEYVRQITDDVFDTLITMSRKNKIDYPVTEIMRNHFDSRPYQARKSAMSSFRKKYGKRPDLKSEKDLKEIIEMSRAFMKQYEASVADFFAEGGLVQPRNFSEGGVVESILKPEEQIEDETTRQMVGLGLDLAPVTGEIRSAQAAVEDFEKGNYGMAALGALGAIPGVGMVARAGTKGVKALSKYADELWDTPTQKITSADTSINKGKLPAGYTQLKNLDVFKPGQRVVDIGGGRFDNAVEDLAKRDVELHVYDPFNRTPEHNRSVKELVADGGADVAVSNNTLNVIKEPENIKRVIQQAENAIKPGDKAYFTVYVGDKSGVGRITKEKKNKDGTIEPKSYQRNEPTSAYVSRVEEVFGKGNVTFKGDLITATKADAIEPKKFGPEDLDMIPDRVFYHGTMADVAEFDPDLVDIGVHIGGNPIQASDRLLDTSDPYTNLPRGVKDYGEGANVIPLRARMKKTLELEDVGDWKNSYEVANVLRKYPDFQKNRAIQDIMEDADALQAQFYGVEEEFRDSIENRELLNELRKLIQEKGYDSIKYVNMIEGRGKTLNETGEKIRAQLNKRRAELENKIVKRAESDPKYAVPKPEDYANEQELEKAIREWTYSRPDPLTYATKEEDRELGKIVMEMGDLIDKYGNDPYSYIVLDPSQLRSALSAKFDPAMRESANLNMNRGGLMSRK
jgi:hypothetical protein